MDIPIEIAGFNRYISFIPSGNVVVLRGGIEPAKEYMPQLLSYTAAKAGMAVSYVTSKGANDLKSHILRFGNGVKINAVEESSMIAWLRLMDESSLLVIDSFSYLMLGKGPMECRAIVEELRSRAKKSGSVVLLVLDDHLLDDMSEASVLHLADGVLSFKTFEGVEGVRRLVRVERWANGEIIDDNIHYTFIEGRMNVDLRYRIT
ncbi:MAG: hypothetical protein WC375_02605 [Methanomassiliicoccales archaeon]